MSLKNNEICIFCELNVCQFTAKMNLQLASIYGYSVIFTSSRSEAESKRNACNNFTNSVNYNFTNSVKFSTIHW